MDDLNEEQKKALRAFRKRLKTTQLDEDSKLGRSPLTGGRNKIVAIQPPLGFGRPMWDELVAKGYLKKSGGGLYELGKPLD
jgi:hypothetical protein